MVAYGPWTQNPDYQQFRTITRSTTPETILESLVGATGTAGFQDPAYSITLDDLRTVVTNAAVGAGAPLFLNTWGVSYAWGYQLSFPNWQSNWAAEVATHTVNIEPRSYAYNPPNQGFTDPDAIGIDYAGQPYDPENPWASAPAEQRSMVLGPETLLGGKWYEEHGGGAREYLPQAPPTRLYLKPQGETEVEILAVEPGSVISGANPIFTNTPAVDLTPHLADANWAGSMRLRVDAINFPWVGPQEGPETIGSDGYLEYGWGFESVRLTSMIRPPLYRWVYASTPYRRTTGRTDNLAGGPGRNYPPSKGQQSGNRTSGGYW